jgi:hypothetical protein
MCWIFSKPETDVWPAIKIVENRLRGPITSSSTRVHTIYNVLTLFAKFNIFRSEVEVFSYSAVKHRRVVTIVNVLWTSILFNQPLTRHRFSQNTKGHLVWLTKIYVLLTYQSAGAVDHRKMRLILSCSCSSSQYKMKKRHSHSESERLWPKITK